ncbi:MAG: malonyl-ACP O-methyltransferase BioC [Candidatus Accumulibacter sp.]|jgi:malonyl-CoA O-methyltransferase|nr:malonyl-ACP O-methyltransferase BioC [Accumulibacter sp.]
MAVSNKRLVRESFGRAAATYDAAAVVQRRVCARLLEELTWENEPPARVLDAGCGTGFGAERLRARWPGARLVGVDFAPAMLAAARRALDDGVAADMEQLPFGPARFDLWWSSLSIQWCDAAAVFAEAARVLAPGGRLAFSTLCPETFAELRAAFAGVDPHRHTLPFSAPEALDRALEDAGLHARRLIRERHTVFYPNLKALLVSIKDIGAHHVGGGARPGLMGRAAWARVEAAYERFRAPSGLPASYDVLLGYAVR